MLLNSFYKVACLTFVKDALGILKNINVIHIMLIIIWWAILDSNQ